MEFLKENIFNILGIISLIVGILAFIDGKSAKKDAKNEKAIRAYLYDVAEKNIDKELTENHINQLKQVETELTGAINEQIPKLAKKTSLTNSLEELKDSLVKDYLEFQHIQEELKIYDVQTSEIPEQISDIVVKNILPDYYRRKEKEKNLIIIAVLFLLYIIISNIPVFSVLQYAIALFMYNPLASLLELTFPKNGKWRLLLKCCYCVVIGVYMTLFSFAGISKSSGVYNLQYQFTCIKISVNNVICILLSVISCFLISFAAAFALKVFIIEKLSAYINTSRKKKIILYSLYYLFWLTIIAIIIFMSTSISIRNYDYMSYIIFEFRLLLICIASGVLSLTALVIPFLPYNPKLGKKHFLKDSGIEKDVTTDLDKK